MRTTFNPQIVLRIGAGICFIGHGVLALTAKAKFVSLLGAFGFEPEHAITLLKFIGVLDVAVGLFILFKPSKMVFQWAMIWTGLTILAWGFYGDSLMDLFRRAVYVTTPMALLLMYSNKTSVAPSISVDGEIELEAKPKFIQPTGEITLSQEEAIEQLDLSMICKKLMDKRDGEGWSKRQCDEVAVEYRKYLKLNMLYPDANIVPNIAIDTMWHYHILDTEAYYRDCHLIFGYILHHYPYFGMGGESDQKQFMSAFDRTKMLYEKTFATSMDNPNYLLSFRV